MHGSADARVFVRRLYWWSFAARLVVGLLGWSLTVTGTFSLLEDSLHYDELAGNIATEFWADGTSPTFDWVIQNRRPTLQILLLAAVYTLTMERITPVGLLVYSLITSLASVFTYKIGVQLGAPERGARTGAWLVALSPAFVFWSGALYKEGLILVLLTGAIYQLLRLQEGWHFGSLAAIALCILGLYSLRFYLALILAGVFLLGLLLGRSRSSDITDVADTVFRQIILAALFVALLLGLGFSQFAREALPTDLSEGLSRMQSSRQDLATTAGSGFGREVDITDPSSALLHLPVGLVYFLTVPWPWDLGNLRQALTVPETAAWVLLYFPAVRGVRAGLRRNATGTLTIVTAAAAISLFYALWISNVGTAYRLRIQVWVLLAVFVGWGLAEMRGPNREETEEG